MDVVLIRYLVPVVLVAACHFDDVAIAGKQCPCPGDYACVAGVCVLGDASSIDAPIDGGAGTCLTNAKTTLVYQSATLAEFPTGFTTIGGDWMTTPTALHQANEVSSIAVAALTAIPGSASSDYRVVATATQTTGSVGGAYEVSARISIANKTMYNCNLEPNDGKLVINRTDPGGATATQLAVMELAGVSPLEPYAIELQVESSELQCCARGIAGASITISDAMLTSGTPGMKTYVMAADFRDFAVYQ